MASLPPIEEVKITDEMNPVIYDNIPSISKVIGKAKTKDALQVELENCKQWTMQTMMTIKAPYFKAVCSYRADIIYRHYEIKATLFIRNWSK